jgi:hypothetical protein
MTIERHFFLFVKMLDKTFLRDNLIFVSIFTINLVIILFIYSQIFLIKIQ